MRIGYIWARPMPSRDTDTQQVMKTVDALGHVGADIDLIVPSRPRLREIGAEAFAREVAEFYGLRKPPRLRAVRAIDPSRFDFERAVHPFSSLAVIKRDEYDVIYTRSRTATLLCGARGLPVVLESYRLLGDELPHLVRVLGVLCRKGSVRGIVTHSEMAAESFERAGFPRERLKPIHNGYDPRDFEPVMSKEQARAELALNQAATICAYTGHVRARKGMTALLDTAALAPEIQFLIAGGNPEDLAELDADIARRGLRNVLSLGWRPAAELRPIMYAADALIIPPSAAPLMEHGRTVLPMKIFSYLAAGRAIIAPDLPDLREVIAHEHSGLLVPPDQPEVAAAALRRVRDEPGLAERLGRGARESARELTWDARARKLLQTFAAWNQR